jgi:hypothetical protein
MCVGAHAFNAQACIRLLLRYVVMSKERGCKSDLLLAKKSDWLKACHDPKQFLG